MNNIIEEITKLRDGETDPLLKKWYDTTLSIVRDASEMKPGYDENAHRTLETTLKTLYPDVDTSDEGLEKATFVGALASTANVVRKEILKMRELKECKSQKTIDVIYTLFHPPVYGKDDEIVIETPKTDTETETDIDRYGLNRIVFPKEDAPIDPRTLMTGMHTRSIDWLARIDPSKYSIRSDGQVINNHRGGVIVLSFMKDGGRCVKLKSGKHNVTMSIRKLMEKAFPEIACINQEKQTINLEAVTKEIDMTRYTTEEETQTSSEKSTIDTEYVCVDWFDDIPKGKYQVYKSGRIVDVTTGEDVPLSAANVVTLSSRIGAPKKGVRSTSHALYAASLVWKAFHPEDRKLGRMYLDYIDGNTSNIALDNLRRSVNK